MKLALAKEDQAGSKFRKGRSVIRSDGGKIVFLCVQNVLSAFLDAFKGKASESQGSFESIELRGFERSFLWRSSF